MARPKIFIASPLFNPEQVDIIKAVETLCESRGLDYYSARKHSGSNHLSPEDRKSHSKWEPVFESNEQGLRDADLMIAVLEYALPEEVELGLRRTQILDELSPEILRNAGVNSGDTPRTRQTFTPIEIPDAGTIFEVGYFRAMGKPVIGFHSTKPSANMNLMLTHGCHGMVSGWENLALFFAHPDASTDWEAHNKGLKNFLASLLPYGSDHIEAVNQTARQFRWSVCSTFDALQKETF